MYYTLKEILDSGEIIEKVYENEYCYIFYTSGKNTKFRSGEEDTFQKDGKTNLLRWGFDKETNEVGACENHTFLIHYAHGGHLNSFIEKKPEILIRLSNDPIKKKKESNSVLNDYEDDYI